jgi:hypothetical protein
VKHSTTRAALLFSVAAGVLATMTSAGAAEAAPPGWCDVSLAVELTPDVPNPSDVGFLSSLLSNHPDYRLVFRGRSEDDSAVLLELIGPGPDYVCRSVLQTMRRDGRILSVHLDRNFP